MQSGANGLTVDDARRLGKELDCVHLGHASSPRHLSLTEGRSPLRALPLQDVNVWTLVPPVCG